MSTINKANSASLSPAATAPALDDATVSATHHVESSATVAEAPPLYRSFMPAQTPGDISGLSMPQNVEDTAILLAKVMVDLESGRRASAEATVIAADAGERLAVAEELSKIAEARTALDGDSSGKGGLNKQRSDAVSTRDAAQESKSGVEKELAAEEKSQSDRETDLRDAEKRSSDTTLPEKDRKAAEEEATKLKADISAGADTISKLKDKSSELEGTISGLNSKISDLDSKIATATQNLELAQSALTFASARLVAARANAMADQDLDMASTDEALTQILKTSQDEIRDLRDRIVARFEDTRQTREDLTKVLENDRVLAAAIGLATALTATTEVVRREAGAAQDDEARVQAARLAV